MTTQELEEPKLNAAKVKQLRPFFNKNCSADYTASKTGVARGTVQKYFKAWSKILIETLDDNFIRMQKDAKARGLLALEARIGELNEVLDDLRTLNDGHMKREKALWKKDKHHEIELNKWLVDKIAKYTKDIFNMEQIKVMIQMKPTADVTLQAEIDIMLSKVKPEDLQKLVDEAKENEDKTKK